MAATSCASSSSVGEAIKTHRVLLIEAREILIDAICQEEERGLITGKDSTDMERIERATRVITKRVVDAYKKVEQSMPYGYEMTSHQILGAAEYSALEEALLERYTFTYTESSIVPQHKKCDALVDKMLEALQLRSSDTITFFSTGEKVPGIVYGDDEEVVLPLNNIRHMIYMQRMRILRNLMRRLFGYGYFRESTAKEMAKFVNNRTVLGLGSGRCWGEAMLSAQDTPVIATDDCSWKSFAPPFRNRTLTVAPALAALAAVTHWSDIKNLFISWPPYGESGIVDAVKLFTKNGGEKIIYIGEGRDGCTGSDEFHEFLHANYECVASYEDNPAWTQHDLVFFYVRKTPGPKPVISVPSPRGAWGRGSPIKTADE